jgi:uncharacterized protein (DUF1015 family)
MAIVQAFRGWLYDLSRVGKLADVTAPPYDIIDPQRQIELYSRHPANVVRLILNQWQDGDEPEDRYRRPRSFGAAGSETEPLRRTNRRRFMSIIKCSRIKEPS